MAMVEPTDRSMPSVAMTRAIPTATMATGATCTNCSRRLVTVAKLGVNTRLKTRITALAR
jgi:hypothetical protein